MIKPTADSNSVEKTVKDCYSTWGTSYYSEYFGEKAPYPSCANKK